MPHQITIVDYRPEWPKLCEQELDQLEDIIGPYVADIQHIGSTSVPGLAAKPIIDIMIGVDALAIADHFCVKPMVDNGYEYVQAYESQIPHRRYFRKSDQEGKRTHHLHLVEVDSQWWERHILFRDYLREYPEDRDAYGELKKKLAEREYEDKHEYTRAKTEFITKILEKARLLM